MLSIVYSIFFSFFFFTDTATTEIYTLSLHDALPISIKFREVKSRVGWVKKAGDDGALHRGRQIAPEAKPLHADRKSTRLNSSHVSISYAVFCLKKKKNKK